MQSGQSEQLVSIKRRLRFVLAIAIILSAGLLISAATLQSFGALRLRVLLSLVGLGLGAFLAAIQVDAFPRYRSLGHSRITGARRLASRLPLAGVDGMDDRALLVARVVDIVGFGGHDGSRVGAQRRLRGTARPLRARNPDWRYGTRPASHRASLYSESFPTSPAPYIRGSSPSSPLARWSERS